MKDLPNFENLAAITIANAFEKPRISQSVTLKILAFFIQYG